MLSEDSDMALRARMLSFNKISTMLKYRENTDPHNIGCWYFYRFEDKKFTDIEYENVACILAYIDDVQKLCRSILSEHPQYFRLPELTATCLNAEVVENALEDRIWTCYTDAWTCTIRKVLELVKDQLEETEQDSQEEEV